MIAHEARHNEVGGHTCGNWHTSLFENGAWAIQYYMALWEAVYVGAFLDVPPTVPDAYPTFACDQALYRAEAVLQRDFCAIPSADLSVLLWAGPNPVPSGGYLSYEIKVSNAGPDDSPRTWVTFPIPTARRWRRTAAAASTSRTCRSRATSARCPPTRAATSRSS